MRNLKYSEIIRRNKELSKSVEEPVYNIGLLSNLIIHQINPILEYSLRKSGISAIATCGDYDNIMHDCLRFKNSKCIILFWELSNLIDGLQYKVNVFTEVESRELISRFKEEISFVFRELTQTPLVILNKFSTSIFNHHFLKKNKYDDICDELNKYILERLPSNFIIVDIDKIFLKISVSKSVDFRNFYSSKSLYSIEFLKEYVYFITPIIESLNAKTKKALIFDCDNTLWSGIIGEDGINGIMMSSANAKGVVYEEVQFLAKEAASKGILIGLNSKNNAEDVEEVFNSHSDINLQNSEIIIKKVNWIDKVSNIKEISKDLNIGIDSLVFVDDSDFEINMIGQELPTVKTIKVPVERFLYPDVLRQHLNLFYKINETSEDFERVRMYKDQIKRSNEISSFTTIDDYLKTLDLQIFISINNDELIPRVAQLTQKTNQFNLTTKRYSEAEVQKLCHQNSCFVFAIKVVDKFGDFGVTGASIIEIQNDSAIIDSFLLSCRILGRKVEVKLLEEILKFLFNKGVTKVRASYIKTLKNSQVETFFENQGFYLESSDGTKKQYSFKYSLKNNYLETNIKVHYD